jgi:hypothetical protein
MLIDRINGDTALNLTGTLLRVDRQNTPKMVRHVQDHRPVGALTRQTRSAATRQKRNPIVIAKCRQSRNMLVAFRNDHGEGVKGIIRGVRRVNLPVMGTGSHLADAKL